MHDVVLTPSSLSPATAPCNEVGPIFGSARTGNPSGRDWSADGRAFVQVVGELPGNARLELGHDHCLDIWNARNGYRRLVCGSDLPRRARSPRRGPHFDRVIWSADGSAFLLNNGTVVSRGGDPLESAYHRLRSISRSGSGRESRR
jgi:hypothetical protein